MWGFSVRAEDRGRRLGQVQVSGPRVHGDPESDQEACLMHTPDIHISTHHLPTLSPS